MHWLDALRLMPMTALIISISLASSVGSEPKSPDDDVQSQDEPMCHNTCNDTACVERMNKVNSLRSNTTSPCVDFYKHVCENWTGDDPMALLRNNIRSTLKRLMNETPEEENDASTEKPVVQATNLAKKAFKRCTKSMEEKIPKKREGIQRILKMYGLDEWPTAEDAGSENAQNLKILRGGLKPFAVLQLVSNQKTPPKYIPSINHPRFEFVNIPKWNKTTNLTDMYRDLIKTTIIELTSIENNTIAEKIATEIIGFEQDLANNVPPTEEQGHLMKSLRNLSKTVLEGLPLLDALNFDFNESDARLNMSDKIVVRSLSYFQNLTYLINNTERRILKNYVGWTHVRDLVDVASENLRNKLNMLKDNISRPRVPNLDEDGCIQRFSGRNGLLDNAISYMYLTKNFSKQSKTDVDTIVYYLNVTFSIMLKTNAWMDQKTKNRSRERIEKTVFKMGYKDELLNETFINDLYQFVLDINESVSFLEIYASLQRNLFLQNLRHNRELYNTSAIWRISPLDTEGTYNNFLLDLEMPAGAFGFPFYDYKLPDTINLGSMGARMAEELTYGFSDTGIIYRTNGTKKRNFWSYPTERNFQDQIECLDLKAQAASLDTETVQERVDDKEVEGSQEDDNGSYDDDYAYDDYTSYEDEDYDDDPYIDDTVKFVQHVGLRTAFNAFVLMVYRCGNGSIFDGQTPEQTFFTSYALSHCRQQNAQDYVRTRKSVNLALATYNEFANAYSCEEGQPMKKNDTCNFMGVPIRSRTFDRSTT